MLIMKHFLNPDDFEMPTAELFLKAYGNPLTLTSFIEPFVSNRRETYFGFEDSTVQPGPPKDDENDFGFGDPSVQPGPPEEEDEEEVFGF